MKRAWLEQSWREQVRRDQVWRKLAGASVAAALLGLAACDQHGGFQPRGASNLGSDYAALGDAPADARPGACYKKVARPAQVETVTEQVLVRPAGPREEIVPAVYETVTERVLVREATTRRVQVPATYRVETQRIEISPEVERVKVIPAQFRTIRETVWLAPDGTQHAEAPRVARESRRRIVLEEGREVRKHANKVAPGDRVIATDGNYRVVIEPPRHGYKSVTSYGPPPGWRQTTISRREMVRPEETRTYVEPARHRTVRARVVDQPARVEEVPVPAEYEMVTRRKLVTPEQVRVVQAPAEYETVTREVQVAPAGVVWAEILCDAATNETVMRNLQRALFDEGYYRGAVDGTYNVGLDSAVRAYQADNRMAEGGVTMETLASLGVAY